MSDPIYEAQAYEIAQMARIVSALEYENDKLRKRNAKLRGLVRMQDECVASNCEWCKYRKNRESLDVECELDDLARELGIEVE